MTAGGNYCTESNTFNAIVRGAYTPHDKDITYIAQCLKQGDVYSFQLGVSKKGAQGFLEVGNITEKPEFSSTITLSAGISYSFMNNTYLSH